MHMNWTKINKIATSKLLLYAGCGAQHKAQHFDHNAENETANHMDFLSTHIDTECSCAGTNIRMGSKLHSDKLFTSVMRCPKQQLLKQNMVS